MQRWIYTTAALLCMAGPAMADEARLSYRACTEKSGTQPAQALLLARKHKATMGEHSAMHCEALALFRMSRFEEAAELLNSLYKELAGNEKTVPLQVNLMVQLAKAHWMADAHASAEEAIDLAVALAASRELDGLTIESLEQRAMFRMERKAYTQAIQDSDHILSLRPEHIEALMIRARALTALETPELAMEDYQEVLRLQPKHEGAQQAMAKVDAGPNS